jgi:hypothetical protein
MRVIRLEDFNFSCPIFTVCTTAQSGVCIFDMENCEDFNLWGLFDTASTDLIDGIDESDLLRTYDFDALLIPLLTVHTGGLRDSVILSSVMFVSAAFPVIYMELPDLNNEQACLRVALTGHDVAVVVSHIISL